MIILDFHFWVLKEVMYCANRGKVHSERSLYTKQKIFATKFFCLFHRIVIF